MARDSFEPDPTLQAYLRTIARIPQVTPEEEQRLAERLARGDEAARRRLVEGHLRFVVAYAKRYRNKGVPFLDLIHEGNLGLIEAARRFDPDRGVRFLTYGVWWVRQALVCALASQTRPFTIPAKVATAAAKFGREVRALTDRLERAPTLEEIAQDLKLSRREVDTLMHISGGDLPLSPAQTGAERTVDMSEILRADSPDVNEVIVRELVHRRLEAALAELDEREQQIMRWRYGLAGEEEPHTLQQVAERLQLSRERVRQIEARALEKLRRSSRLREAVASLN